MENTYKVLYEEIIIASGLTAAQIMASDYPGNSEYEIIEEEPTNH